METSMCAGSICKMKQNHHFMVPEADFQLLHGEDKLTLYQVCKSHEYISLPPAGAATTFFNSELEPALCYCESLACCSMVSSRLERNMCPEC